MATTALHSNGKALLFHAIDLGLFAWNQQSDFVGNA
jgi:hypothetical protein